MPPRGHLTYPGAPNFSSSSWHGNGPQGPRFVAVVATPEVGRKSDQIGARQQLDQEGRYSENHCRT